MNRIEIAAQAAHEVNRVWCLAHGDTSQDHWEDAPEWQKDSARSGVQGVLDGNDPEASHEGWLAQKESEGWVYGPSKDISTKTHPCMVPFNELPLAQRAKDEIFIATVKAFNGVIQD